MLAKIMSALALTLLLTSGALAYAPQPHNVIYTGHSNSVQLQTQPFAAEPNNMSADHSNSVQPQESLQTELPAEEPHNIYAGHSNSVQPQESLQTQLFAEDTTLSESRQFD